MSTTYVFLKDIDTSKMAENRREVYWPKSLGSRDHYDPSLRATFTSKQKMRRYLAQHGLRDAGERVNPDRHIRGREKTRPNPLQPKIDAYIRQSGGAEGLLRRIKEGRGHFL